MKKLISVLFVLSLVLCMTACAAAPDHSSSTPTNTTGTVPSESQSEPSESGKNSGYTVTVVDNAGDPVVGAVVQMCKIGGDGSCTPSATDAQGKAYFDLPQDNYKVSFVVLPPAYTYVDDVRDFHFDGDSMELTITVNKV